MIGLPVSHVWRGHGSALFIEFGRLKPAIRKSGELGQPNGEFGLMIEWSWRIKDASSILCGSWSDEVLWQPVFDQMNGRLVTSVETFARLPEIAVSLSNGLHVVSFSTADGDPQWALFDRRSTIPLTFVSRNGGIEGEPVNVAGSS